MEGLSFYPSWSDLSLALESSLSDDGFIAFRGIFLKSSSLPLLLLAEGCDELHETHELLLKIGRKIVFKEEYCHPNIKQQRYKDEDKASGRG